ncbi:ricin B-like lectin [Pluteus cervinus]|uniref:Ricin B-like lectin n=1 Tax=Pluteus cervinus TaxID=181527 RepID=A0ACD3A3T4_9AGAR|nr:ricin B-like lectin [Pluteus cervinus]
MIGQKTLVLAILATTLSALALNLPVARSPSYLRIRPGSDFSKCLGAAHTDPDYTNGVPVVIGDCNNGSSQLWLLSPRGETIITLAGYSYCLDAGSSPQNGVGLKIWKCYSGLPAQDWYVTDDHRIALTNQGQCIDLTNGNLTNGAQAQTWQCTDNNPNQYWKVDFA